MSNNVSLGSAKKGKNDEFYTVYEYIQKEINAYLEYNPDTFRNKVVLCPCDDPEWSNFTKFFAQNFENLGLKKLISTSYALDSKKKIYKDYQYSLEDYLTDFEKNDEQFDKSISGKKGKVFTLTRRNAGKVDIDNLKWKYLNGDGDFRSDEVTNLRDEADIIVTNPPFSLFRDFMGWIMDSSTDKGILVIGNQNAITYKEIFPLIKDNKLWLGATCNSEDMVFQVPEGATIAPKDREKAEKLGYKGNYTRLGNSCWFTNLDHGRRHQPLSLMSMDDNIKFSKHKEIKANGYQHYDNYDAIEVPYIDAIPADYEHTMGVPITFLSKYNPEQFELLGLTSGRNEFDKLAYPIIRYENAIQHNTDGTTTSGSKANTRATILVANPKGIYYTADNCVGKLEIVYARILIRKRKDEK